LTKRAHENIIDNLPEPHFPQRGAWERQEAYMAESVSEVTTSTWDSEVIKAQGVVMIDFWAAWCGPCRIISPTIEELSKEYSGKIKVLKLNTDENSDIASKYQVMGIPTIMFFKNGTKLDQIVGVVPKQFLKAKIDSFLNS
jgi:thioredoxin 1